MFVSKDFHREQTEQLYALFDPIFDSMCDQVSFSKRSEFREKLQSIPRINQMKMDVSQIVGNQAIMESLEKQKYKIICGIDLENNVFFAFSLTDTTYHTENGIVHHNMIRFRH